MVTFRSLYTTHLEIHKTNRDCVCSCKVTQWTNHDLCSCKLQPRWKCSICWKI